MKLLYLSLGILFLTIGFAFAQNEMVLVPEIDNTIYEENFEKSNGKGTYLFAGNTFNGDRRRALIKFNLNDLPSNCKIDSVNLILTFDKAHSETGQQTFSVYLISSEWGEGSSDAFGEEGGGAAATENDATWNASLFPETSWHTPGGDFAESSSADFTVSEFGKVYIKSHELTLNVNDWYSGEKENFGWVIVGNESSAPSAYRFFSRETTTEAPQLKVYYSYLNPIKEEKNVDLFFFVRKNGSILNVKSNRPFNYLIIRNVSGKEVLKTSLNEVTIPALAPGVYIAHISFNDKVVTKRFLVR